MYISLTDIIAYIINIPEPVQYHIYAMAFPFDLRCESVTLLYIPWIDTIINYEVT